MKKLAIAALLGLSCSCALAYSVKLRTADPTGEPETYATCRVFAATDSVKAAATGLTDTLGIFTADLPQAGTYTVRIEAAGTGSGAKRQFTVSDSKPDANLGTITLADKAEVLGELTVTAQRPLVTKQIDRIGYDIQADPEVKTLNLSDMLRRVPMVAVDAEGNVTVNGSSNFVIYKNGRPNSSLSKNAKDILKAIPASMIKTVEVITEPGAKYDAEGIGAILNIVTVEGATITGVTGNINLNTSSRNWLPNPYMYLMTQINKVTFSINAGGFFENRRSSKSESKSETFYPDGTTRTSLSQNHNPGGGMFFGGEASWEINSKNLLTAEFNGFYYNVRPKGTGSAMLTGADGSILSSYATHFNYPAYNYLDLDGNLNYQLTTDRKGETLTASYMVSNMAQHNRENTYYTDIVGDAFPYTGIENKYNLDFIEHTFQLDWKRPFNDNHTIEAGGKYILRRNHSTNNINYLDWRTDDTEFKHITDIGAAYAQYTGRFGKVTLRGGLRYEYSRLKAMYPDGSQKDFASNLNDFVPSASASWNINDANTLTFNYATRINRPGIEYLNPAETLTPSTLSKGNPELESAMNHSFKLTYMLIKMKFNFNFSASYAFNNDNISSIEYYDPATGLEVSTYGNIGRQRTLSFSAFAQWTITDKTRFMVNANVSRNSYRQEGMRQARWNVFSFARLSQNLPWKLVADVNLFYMSKRPYSVYTYGGSNMLNWGIGLRRSFLKEDRLTVGLMVQNPIGRSTRNWYTITNNGNFTGQEVSKQFHQKSFGISISYRFGNLNAQVKKTAATIQNDDMVGGGGQGGGSSQSSSQGMGN